MEIETRIRASEDELDEVIGVLRYIGGDVTVESVGEGRSGDANDEVPIDQAVLQAVRADPGRALKPIHRKAASTPGSSIEWTETWSDERETVQRTLRSLEDQGLVHLRERSWYPGGRVENENE